MSKLRYKEGGVWKSIAPSQKEFDDNKAETTALLADKASKLELSNVLNGSPKGTYATLAALQAAYPTGTTGVYIVTADGHIYSWSGTAWVDRGVYQSTGLSNNIVTDKILTTDLYTEIKTGVHKETVLNYLTATTTPGINQTFILDKAIQTVGTLEVVKLTTTGGTAKVSVLRKTDTNSFVVLSVTDVITVAGEAEYPVSINFPETGLYVAVSGGVKYVTGASATSYGYWDYASPLTKDQILTNLTKGGLILTFGIKVEFTFKSELRELSENTELVAKFDKSTFDFISSTLKPVYTERFAASNASWQYTNCSANNGLLCTGSAKAVYNKDLSYDTWYHKSIANVKDIASVFGLVCNDLYNGAVYIVDGVNKTLNLYSAFNGSVIPTTIKATTPMTINLALNKDYILEVFKTGQKHTFSITDPQTLQKDSVTFDNTTQANSSTYTGYGWGKPGVITFSGQILFRNHTYSMAHFPKTKVMFIGDSITEGTAMGANVDIKYRWCSLLRDNLYKGDAIINGRSGSGSVDLLGRLNTASTLGIDADIIVVLIGTNERSDAALITWKTKIVEIADKIIAMGAVPVICVPPIPSSNVTYVTQMKDFILEKGWNTIRFDYATSLNRDGVTQSPSLFADSVHPNKFGSEKMYEQALVDLGLM